MLPQHEFNRLTPKRENLNRSVVGELKKISTLLEPKSPNTWYERLYGRVFTVAKYVGIPGVLIAAIGPTQKLASDLVEYQNKTTIQNVYLDHVETLISEGSIDRANKLLTTLENQKNFDARLQYYRAKVLIAMAIQQGRNYTEALDTVTILTDIAKHKTIFFPAIGTEDDLLNLNLAAIDIDIAQQNYQQARLKIASVGDNNKFKTSPALVPNIEYRLGTIDVLEYKIDTAKIHLEASIKEAEKLDQKLLTANAKFQLAKATQFGSEHPKALELYSEAADIYEHLPDKFGLLKTYNNMAMIYFDDLNNDKARLYYNREQTTAREVGDELGYARATNNIALIEKREQNFSAAVRLATEAFGVFKQQNNLLGMISASNTLANSYNALGNIPEAVAYAKQNLDISIELRELRAVSASCGTLSDIYRNQNDQQELIFASLCAATLVKELNLGNVPNSATDYQLYVSRIKECLKDKGSGPALLDDAQKRVEDILLKLNLGTESLRNVISVAFAE